MDFLEYFRNFITTILIICSTFTGVLGMFIIFFGVRLEKNYHVLFDDRLNMYIEDLNKFKRDIPQNLPESFTALTKNVGSVNMLSTNISASLTVLGVIFIISSFAGCYVSLLTSRVAAFAYTGFVFILTLVVFFEFFGIKSSITGEFTKSLNSYKGLGDSSSNGIAWNTLMIGMKCCGVDGYEDFETLPNWPPKELQSHVALGNSTVQPQIASTSTSETIATSLEETMTTLNTSVNEPLNASTNEPSSTSTSQTLENRTENPDIPINLVEVSNIETKCTSKYQGPAANCSWMKGSNFKTPMACCKDPKQIDKKCHLKGFANEANNWLTIGCGYKLLSYLQFKTNSLATFGAILAFMIVHCGLLVGRILVGDANEDLSKNSFKRKASEHSFTIVKDSVQESVHSIENISISALSDESDTISQLSSTI